MSTAPSMHLDRQHTEVADCSEHPAFESVGLRGGGGEGGCTKSIGPVKSKYRKLFVTTSADGSVASLWEVSFYLISGNSTVKQQNVAKLQQALFH